MNAIVYSIHSSLDNPNELIQFQEIHYSIDTIRQFSDIPIEIYISPKGTLNKLKKSLFYKNVNVTEFDVKIDKRIPKQVYASWFSHKIESALNALEKYDNVLYIDADTMFFKDPQIIFDKYLSLNKICGNAEQMLDFVEFLGESGKMMNDSIVLIPKKFLIYKKDLIESRINYIVELVEKYKDLDKNSNFWKYGINWAASQYGMYKYLDFINETVNYFGPDVVVSPEFYEGYSQAEKENVIVLHYTSQNAYKYLPQKYWNDQNNFINHMELEL